MKKEEKPAGSSIVKSLTEITNPNGSKIQLRHCTSMGVGPADLNAFFYKSLSEVISTGQASTWPSYNFKSQAVYAVSDEKVIGLVVFNYTPEKKQVYIVLSAVDPAFRKRGLYKIMQTEVAKIGKSLGAVEVTSFIHISNEITLKASKSCTFEPVYYKMVRKL
jgi:ribosomal protein S18 acetylase RimI-like enzyme